MPTNGTPNSPPIPSHSPSNSISTKESRVAIDSERSVSNSAPPTLTNGVNGHTLSNGKQNEDDDGDLVERLQRELEQTREEKETLATQYRNLLAKLTQMRTTLGNKLKQDAEELDRREQLIQQLTTQNEDLLSTVETLKQELIDSHEEADRAQIELDAMRNRALHENAQEALIRERELREAQTELERCRMERDEWERTALHEKVISDDLKSTAETLTRDLELEREAREREADQLVLERQKSENLQSVLQDFQSDKDRELRQAVKDYESQVVQTTQLLAEFKHRALTAELQLEESNTNITRTQELEKEVKEKTFLIGKLRHEAVILNEHLMEALRRLRRNSTDTNVDRRLVTNVLLSFLNTPRADGKRFEMLSLLSSILSWSEQEREKAGLQRSSSFLNSTIASPPSSSFWSRSVSASGSPAGKAGELEKSDETESFSRLWVEFLLTEAAAGDTPSRSASNTSLPGSPTVSSHLMTPTKGGRRLSSFSSAGMASSPSLLQPPPSRKGKEKAPDS